MNWGKIIMDSIVVAIISLIAVVISAIITDFKGYKKIAGKIGNLKSDTLEGQHERIKETIAERANSIEKMQNNEFNRIFNKVDNIDKEMVANKERYASLNLDQRGISDNVNRLVNEWEYAIVENKELKNRIKELEIKNRELEKQYKDLSFKYRKEKSRENDIEK